MFSKEEKTIVRMEFGSKLYGTSTPESDTDYKSIYLPSVYQLVTGEYPEVITNGTGDGKSKNTKDDIDDDCYSIHKFVKLAVDGDAVAMDMLHCEKPVIESEAWDFIRANRTKFYCKNMKSYVGYVRQQAAKYGVKGSRLAALKEAIEFLSFLPKELKLSEALQNTRCEPPTNEFCKVIFIKNKQGQHELFYSVLGKNYQFTNYVWYIVQQLTVMMDSYGDRAKLAEKNEGVDWKALHHALRVSYQLQDIHTKGDFKYPLDQTDYLMKVKLGQVDFNEVSEELHRLELSIKELSEKSSLPEEKMSKELMCDFIEQVYLRAYP